ncbi:AraC-like DNA-binding protein [Sinorhizobium terangae]|uniref:Helix-turn-helix domain-containing protein n=1 Tax=Sinorhizobium terangae TaxID=110322 RepID=A0A6N7LMD7_SINTE|nr:AraC family transcriptional regulator [Sinorhizobium terangae]MBB4189367.1 AraC-like DNA-binding protein [Sinorhizobium terangae]MQX18952.1 helix-turn-helix domain-containing protein [Sinorhizobium terangae]MQX19041.1 helix-turn-helix domain-containing protein [Sinorhizobium terangae]
MAKDYAPRLGKFTGLEQPATLTFGTFQAPEFSAARLIGEFAEGGTPVRLETSDAYLVCTERNQLPSWHYWIDGRPAQMSARVTGQSLLRDLNQEHSSLAFGCTDCLSFYISRHALQKFQEEHGLRPTGELRTAGGTALDDTVVHSLGECLLPVFKEPAAASRVFIDHIGMALMSHLSLSYGVHDGQGRLPRGGLAPWQERRAKDLLMANVSGSISLEELAKGCGLSRSHFARAFKVTTGSTPLQWLAQQRIALAQGHLRYSSLSLHDIAEQCGFSDQGHFSRVFSQHVGETPGRWRRSVLK